MLIVYDASINLQRVSRRLKYRVLNLYTESSKLNIWYSRHTILNENNVSIVWYNSFCALQKSFKPLKLLENRTNNVSNKIWPQGMSGIKDTYIFMFHMLEQPQFTIGSLREDLWLKGSVQLFDGHLLFGFIINGRAKKRRTNIIINKYFELRLKV